MAELPPFLIFFAGALLLPALPRAARRWAFLAPPLAVLILLAGFRDGTVLSFAFLNWELTPLRVDRLALVFAWIFAIAAFVGGVYALHLRDTGQQVSVLVYVGGAMGVIFAGDLFTLFVFWEIMAVSSAYLTWARKTPEGYAAGMRYLYVHLFGGALLMAGILLHFSQTGSLAFEAFAAHTPAAWLILLGFSLNAAIPPLHAWLADAYPKATVTGAVFLSAFTTKTAVYALARGFVGWEILVPAGVAMALYGVVYAVLANDIRELLAYHIVSQVGYMVAGVGLGSAMAIDGATGHAFTHILYKGLLFMGAGAVLHATGRSKLTELGGLARLMPWTVALYMVGAFSISGVPLFSGFVSKTITTDAAQLLGRDGVVLLLQLASVGTFLHTGLKLPYFTWWGDGPRRPYGRLEPIPWNMMAGMALAAGLNIFLGLAPGALYAVLPHEIDYAPYTYTHVIKASQLLLFTFLAFWVLRRKLGGEPLIAIDTDWFYRRPARFAYRAGPTAVAATFGAVERAVNRGVAGLVRVGGDPVGWVSGRARDPVTSAVDSSSTALRVTMTAMVLLVLASVLGILALIRLGGA